MRIFRNETDAYSAGTQAINRDRSFRVLRAVGGFKVLIVPLDGVGVPFYIESTGEPGAPPPEGTGEPGAG